MWKSMSSTNSIPLVLELIYLYFYIYGKYLFFWNYSLLYSIFYNLGWVGCFLKQLLSQWFLKCGWALLGVLWDISVGPQVKILFRIKRGYFLPLLSLFFHEPVVTHSRGYMTYDIAQKLGMQRFFHYVLPSGDLQKCKINHSLIFFCFER